MTLPADGREELDVDQSGILTDAKEPSKMSPDEERPMAENEASKEIEQVSGQDAPLTKEEFADQMQRLAERARAAGLKPIETMARTYIKHGMAIIEGLLDSLDNADSSKKKN